MYMIDHNHHTLSRVDVNAPPYLPNNILPNSTFNATGTRGGTVGTTANPVFCYPDGGSKAANPTLTGYVTNDLSGDGCPGVYGTEFATASGTAVPDGLGNLWVAAESDFSILEFSLGNQFLATPVGQALNPKTLAGQQTIDVHFDQSNLPTDGSSDSGRVELYHGRANDLRDRTRIDPRFHDQSDQHGCNRCLGQRLRSVSLWLQYWQRFAWPDAQSHPRVASPVLLSARPATAVRIRALTASST